MEWRDIPSLPALRAFEVAARQGSYSAAARELNVTHAAITQHIKKLEDHFGRPLMVRQGQSMQPTEDGRHLAAALSDGFGTIAAAARDLLTQAVTRPVRIATTHSFAENWLMPRIGSFWTAHPEITLEIVPAIRSVDLRREGFDIALRYGRGDWPGVNAERLAQAGHTIVARPGLIPEPTPEALQAAHWILVGFRREEPMWLRAAGLDPDAIRVSYFDTGALVLQAVRAGHGVSVQPHAIVAHDLATGALEQVLATDDIDLHYYIVTRPDLVSGPTRTFIRWLKSQA